MSDPATQSYIRPDDGARMVAIAPWQFVAAELSQGARAARDEAARKKRARKGLGQ